MKPISLPVSGILEVKSLQMSQGQQKQQGQAVQELLAGAQVQPASKPIHLGNQIDIKI